MRQAVLRNFLFYHHNSVFQMSRRGQSRINHRKVANRALNRRQERFRAARHHIKSKQAPHQNEFPITIKQQPDTISATNFAARLPSAALLMVLIGPSAQTHTQRQ